MTSVACHLDHVFFNGSVLTMNVEDKVAEAVGVSGNRILCVGSREEVCSLGDENTNYIDLRGRSLVPGFIDSHFHPILNGLFGQGEDASIIDISYAQCPTIGHILALVEKAAAKRPKGSWISMMGYDQNRIAEGRHITLEELDKAAPFHRIQCMRTCGHVCVYNSLALASIGVKGAMDADKYPKNEIVVEKGTLTGLVKDHTHFYLWSQMEYSEEEQTRAAMSSQNLLLENGITSIHDPGEFGTISFRIMQRLCRERLFKPRVYMMLHSIYGKPLSKAMTDRAMILGLLTGLGDEHFRIGSCKFMIDGGTSGPSCATREPYDHDPDLPGILGWEREEAINYIRKIHNAGCQATAHAVGDLAVSYMVEGFERAQAENPRKNARHRIEHCSIVDPDLIRRIAELELCPSLNPGFLLWNGKNYSRYFGKRMQYFTALRSMLDAGIRVSLGSDAPSGPLRFFEILDGAVNRIDRSTDTPTDKKQAITLHEALRLYTINGAYASFEEGEKGSIEPGKLADLVVLSTDISSLDDTGIKDLRVDLTMLDGNIEYQREMCYDQP